MTDSRFAAEVEQAYRTPVPDLDEAALARTVLKAIQGADRRRRLVLAGATALGTGIAAAGLLALAPLDPLGAVAHEAGLLLAAVRQALAALPSPWAFALVGLVLGFSAVARTLEDS